MNNLDMEKHNVSVLVFDGEGAFLTAYEESVHVCYGRTRAKVAEELTKKLRLTAYYNQGCTFVCDADETGPVLVSRLFDTMRMSTQAPKMPSTPLTRAYDQEVGTYQFYTEGDANRIPKGYQVPKDTDMTFGNICCDHDCDREHVLELGQNRIITSVRWTSDGGFGPMLRPGQSIGHHWIAKIATEEETLFEVICDIARDASEDASRKVTLQTLENILSSPKQKRDNND